VNPGEQTEVVSQQSSFPSSMLPLSVQEMSDTFTRKVARWLVKNKIHEQIGKLMVIARVTKGNRTWQESSDVRNNVVCYGVSILVQLLAFPELADKVRKRHFSCWTMMVHLIRGADIPVTAKTGWSHGSMLLGCTQTFWIQTRGGTRHLQIKECVWKGV
jgi:hypothetical protein